MSARKNPAAVSLGRRGGRAKTAAKAEAARRNGRLGGRPSATRKMRLPDGTTVSMHEDAYYVGIVCRHAGTPAWRHQTMTAYRWLRRAGYTYEACLMATGPWEGNYLKCWTKIAP